MSETALKTKTGTMNNETPTTLFIVGANYPGEGPYHLIAENGEHFFSHWCKNKSSAKVELYQSRESRQAELARRYGKFDVVMLQDPDENQTGMNLAELYRRNKVWFESLAPSEAAGVEMRHDQGYGDS
jgi:hypothetical protein